MAKAKKVSEKKKKEIKRAMFATMEATGDLYPKNKAGNRTKPKKKK